MVPNSLKVTIGTLLLCFYSLNAMDLQLNLDQLRTALDNLSAQLGGGIQVTPTPSPGQGFTSPLAPPPPPPPGQAAPRPAPSAPATPQPAVTPTPSRQQMPGLPSAEELAARKLRPTTPVSAPTVTPAKSQEPASTPEEMRARLASTGMFAAKPGAKPVAIKKTVRPIALPKEETIVETKITNLLAFKAEVDQLKVMKSTIPDEKRAQKNKAESVLMGLQSAIKPPVEIDKQNELLKKVKEVLNINPLGMTLAIQGLKKAGLPQKELYNLMVEYFKNKVEFLEQEVPKITKQTPFGIRYDIEEAFFYPDAIKSELDSAKGIQNSNLEAKTFVQEIDTLYQRLLNLTKQNKEKLTAAEVPVEIYIRKIAGNPVYCITKTYEHSNNPRYKDNIYVSIFDNLNQIKNGIDAYYKTHTTQRLRQYVIDETLKMLQEIVNIYSTSCTTCLGWDLNEYQTNAIKQSKVNEQLDLIEKFIKDLKVDREALADAGLQNLNRLRNIFKSPGCPIRN